MGSKRHEIKIITKLIKSHLQTISNKSKSIQNQSIRMQSIEEMFVVFGLRFLNFD